MSTLTDILLAGPRALVNGVSQSIDGIRNQIYYPPNYNGVPINPGDPRLNDPRYAAGSVPYAPTPPGTVPGPQSGFMETKLFGNVTGTHVVIGVAGLAALLIVARLAR